MPRGWQPLLLACALAGCTGEIGASTAADALSGAAPPQDAAAIDQGVLEDAGASTDAQPGAPDGGAAEDAAREDAAGEDAAQPEDAALAEDATVAGDAMVDEDAALIEDAASDDAQPGDDAATPDVQLIDAATPDGSLPDAAAAQDAAAADAVAADAAPPDAARPDAAAADAAPLADAALADAALPDAAAPDAAPADAAAADGSVNDGGVSGSAGCGLPVTTGASNQSIVVNGTTRTYLLVVPTTYDPSTPMRLLFGFHGSGGTSTQGRNINVETAANRNEAIWVYPDGLPVSGGASGWLLTASNRDLDLFDALLAHLLATHCVDPARVFAFGFSYGAYFSNALACARSSQVRAFGAIAGGGPFFACSGAVAAWITHAQDDNVVAYAEGVASRDDWVQANGCTTNTLPTNPTPPCEAYQGCSADNPVIWCPRVTGGHSWPNWVPQSIWSFFLGF